MQIDTYLAGVPVPGMRVLIAENEVFDAEVLQKMLGVLGFRDIRHAWNGQEALQRAQQEPCHLVITDLHMPEMDGIGLAAAMRKVKGSESVPVIMLTGYRDAEYVVKAKKAGVSHYIGKPFDILTLRQKIIETYSNLPPHIYGDSHRRLAQKGLN